MDAWFLTLLALVGAHLFKSREQHRRIALLGSHLRDYQIEKLMETLTEGYLRALGEADPERRAQIWALLDSTEQSLCRQFQRFTTEFAQLDEAQTRVSTLPVGLPLADRLLPRATFDLRKALAIHARGLANAAANRLGQSPRDKAYTLSAELFLMQHTCHWFCKSKAVASARLLARHKTSYEQVLAAVAPDTREAYLALVGR